MLRTSVVKTRGVQISSVQVAMDKSSSDIRSWLNKSPTVVSTATDNDVLTTQAGAAGATNKEDICPAPQTASEYLRSLIEDPGWRRVLNFEFKKEYMNRIVKFLDAEEAKGVKIFPPRSLIFNAFNLTPLADIRVVLLGQDPYHDDNQAHGLCFSVCKGVRPPPSLANMYRELQTDIPNFRVPEHGCLESWARQGVFMLNASLTVEAHKANSHSHIGWQKFTDEVIRIISRDSKGVVFLLWGGFAHKKEILIDRKKHVVIKAAHPSPLSARLFFGCKCFSKTNDALRKLGKPAIDWATL